MFLNKLDNNPNVDYKAFRRYIFDKEVCVTYISIFELLNQKKYRIKYRSIINNLILFTKKVHFLADEAVAKECPISLLNNLEDKTRSEQLLAYNLLS